MSDVSLLFNVLAKDHATGVFDKVGAAAKVAMAAVAGAGAALVGSSIKAASDLSETQSKVQTLFGASAGSVEDFAATAARSLGQSKQSALDAASTFAVFGKGAGLSGQELVGFSTKMTSLSSDLASFSNTSPEEAIEAIGAALRGESEPIRKYGVLLDDATLRNRAMAMGLTATTKEALTPQQKALAAQAEILAQTTTQQGDFARTSGGLANQQRILAAEFANTKTELGMALLPIVLKAASALSDMVKWGKANQDWLVPAIGIVAALAGVLYTASIVMKGVAVAQTLINIAMMANPIGLIVLLIVGLVAVFVILWNKSEGFRDFWIGVWEAISGGVMAAVGWITDTAWPAIVGFFTGIANAANQARQWIIDRVADWVSFVLSVPGRVGEGLLNMWNGVKDGATDAKNWVIDRLAEAVNWITDLPGKVGDSLRNMWNGLQDGFKAAINWVIDKWNNFKLEIPGLNVFGHEIGGFTLDPPNVERLAEGGVIRSAGLALVGERGPELLHLPQGAAVEPLPRLGGGGVQKVEVTLEFRGGDSEFRTMMQRLVRRYGSGNVQAAFGGP